MLLVIAFVIQPTLIGIFVQKKHDTSTGIVSFIMALWLDLYMAIFLNNTVTSEMALVSLIVGSSTVLTMATLPKRKAAALTMGPLESSSGLRGGRSWLRSSN